LGFARLRLHAALSISILFLHSWMRWVVLAAAVIVVLRALRGWLASQPWGPTDDKAGRIFTGVLDLQFLLGLILYAVLSPITRARSEEHTSELQSRENL